MGSLGLSLLCQSLQGGRGGTDAFLPFQSKKDCIDGVLLSEGWRGGGLLWREVRLWWHVSIATRGASRHQDFLRDPIHFWVMEGEPGRTYNHHLLSKVCNRKMCPFGVTSEVEGDMDFFCD